MIDLAPEYLALVLEILNRRIPGVEVWVFGSRVQGKAKPHSDLDLVLIGEAPLNGVLLAELDEDFRESDLPMRVDLVEWAGLSEKMRETIRGQHACLVKREDEPTEGSRPL